MVLNNELLETYMVAFLNVISQELSLFNVLVLEWYLEVLQTCNCKSASTSYNSTCVHVQNSWVADSYKICGTTIAIFLTDNLKKWYHHYHHHYIIMANEIQKLKTQKCCFNNFC